MSRTQRRTNRVWLAGLRLWQLRRQATRGVGAAAEEEVAAEEPKIPWEDQKVRVRLFKDNERYKDDVTVVVNGKVWRIQRGVDVDLPMYVWQVLEQSMAQDTKTAVMIQKESDDFKEKQKHFEF